MMPVRRRRTEGFGRGRSGWSEAAEAVARELGDLALAALLAAALAASGVLAPVDRALLDALAAALGVGQVRALEPALGVLASVALVVVPGLLVLRRNARTALPVAILLPAAASVLALWVTGVWLAPMAALVATKLPVALRWRRQRRAARAALEQERGRALAVLGAIDQAVLELDGDGTVWFANPAAERLLGVSPGALAGRRWSGLAPLHDLETGEPIRDLAQLVASAPRLALLTVADRPAREVRVHARPRAGGSVLVAITDVSEVSQLHARLLRQTTHDALTGLPNRELARAQLAQALARAKREGKTVALALLDLDRFRHVNEALGRSAGDALLREVAERLVATCRKQDVVARLGGDEFLVVAEQLASAEAAAGFVGKLVASFDAPFVILNQDVPVTPSVGVSLFPADGDTEEELLRAADVAAQAAKREGTGLRFFTSDLDAAARAQLRVRRSLAGALGRGEFSLHYQARVSLRDFRPTGFEALLRWCLGERGFVPPGLFVPIAESAGLIEPITRFVLREASARCRAWQRAGLPGATVAVNISARHLLHGDLVGEVGAALEASGLAPTALTLELTEGTLVRDPERAIAQLRRLKGMGVKIAVDDFGTGYSSLAYLRDLPVDTVKIDRGFVTDVDGCSRHWAIVAAIVRLAEGLGFGTVAEGVETPGQVAFLREAGCAEAQGYLFARPVPPEEVEGVLRALTGQGPRPAV